MSGGVGILAGERVHQPKSVTFLRFQTEPRFHPLLTLHGSPRQDGMGREGGEVGLLTGEKVDGAKDAPRPRIPHRIWIPPLPVDLLKRALRKWSKGGRKEEGIRRCLCVGGRCCTKQKLHLGCVGQSSFDNLPITFHVVKDISVIGKQLLCYLKQELHNTI